MQAVGEGPGKTRDFSNSPALLNGLGLLEKLPVSLLFGAIMGLCSQGFDIWWLAWFGLLPLLVLIKSCSRLLEAALIGFIYGFAYNLISHSWILELYPLSSSQIHDGLGLLAVLSLWSLEAAHQAILTVLLAMMAYALPTRAGLLPHFKRPFFPYIFSIPLVYVFLHWAVAPSKFFFGVPVNQLAYTQSSVLPLMQVCSLGGCQLLDFLIVLFNAALAVSFFELFPFIVKPLPVRIDRLSHRGGALFDLFLVAVLVGAAAFWGELRLRKLTEFPPYQVNPDSKVFAPPVSVAVLQGNIPVRPEQFESFSRGERLEKYSKLASRLGVSMLVMPEACLRLQDAEGATLFSRIAGICAFEKKEALLGSFEMLDSNLVDVLRLIKADGRSDSLYVKTRLLPLVESAPFSSLAGAIPQNLFSLLPSSKNNFFVSPTPLLLKSVWGNVGASISFELVYPELIAQEVHDGAALLVNVSDLSWFHNSALSRHLMAAAVARAVENGRYLVMASNTGISAVVNPLGVVTSTSLSGQGGNLIDRVQFLSARTHFTRLWWLWRPGCRI